MKRIVYILRYIRHVLVANSRHGTHSPFVYALADQVVYRRVGESGQVGAASHQLLGEIGRYFAVSYTSCPTQAGSQYALCVRKGDVSVDDLARWQQVFRYLVIADIHNDERRRRLWSSLRADARFVVTIDLFFFGLVFYRAAQRKQHFVLRFPFWKYW